MKKKDPQARTTKDLLETLTRCRHWSVREAEGKPHVFSCEHGDPLVTRDDVRRLIILGKIRMLRTDTDGWEWAPVSNFDCWPPPSPGEQMATLATFDNAHRDPATRHRFGQYHPPPTPIEDKSVVSVWQGKDLIKTTALPREKRK